MVLWGPLMLPLPGAGSYWTDEESGASSPQRWAGTGLGNRGVWRAENGAWNREEKDVNDLEAGTTSWRPNILVAHKREIGSF